MLSLGRTEYPPHPMQITEKLAWEAGWRAYFERVVPPVGERGELLVPYSHWSSAEQTAYCIAPRGQWWHFYLQGWREAFDADR